MGVPHWAVGIEGRSATKHLLHSSHVGAMNVFYMVCILLLQSPDSSQILLLSWQRGFDVLSDSPRSHVQDKERALMGSWQDQAPIRQDLAFSDCLQL